MHQVYKFRLKLSMHLSRDFHKHSCKLGNISVGLYISVVGYLKWGSCDDGSENFLLTRKPNQKVKGLPRVVFGSLRKDGSFQVS